MENTRRELEEKINFFFQSVSNDLTPLSPDDITHHPGIIPDEYIISINAVEKCITCLNINKCTGLDAIPNWILRDLASTMAGPIAAIFKSSIRES